MNELANKLQDTVDLLTSLLSTNKSTSQSMFLNFKKFKNKI